MKTAAAGIPRPIRVGECLSVVMLPTIDFNSIREHNGAKHRGFEELVVQLIPSINDVAGREVVRHGTPDGGLEAHVQFEDGSVWGWQAKYFFALGNSQLSQMKASFETALEAYPTLSRYTFVLPFNPPSGNPAHGQSAMQRLDEAFARWGAEAAEKGCTVKLCLVAESRLVDILTAEEHTGRVRYWFDRRVLFSQTWFGEKLDVAINAAGRRYTPEVNVELPLGFAFEGLGRTKAFGERLADVLADVASAATSLSPPKQDSGLTEELRSDIERVANAIEPLVSDLGEMSFSSRAPLNWDADLARILEVQRLLGPLSQKLSERSEFLRGQKAADEPAGQRQPWEVAESLRFGARQAQGGLSELADFLRGQAACLAVKPFLFLSGEAGTGKTHLLCDIALRRLNEGRPTVLLLGQQLEAGNPRTLLPRQLDLPDLTMDQFLSALNTAGEVAGTRALVIVDAINEGGGLDTWPPHLRSLAAEISKYSHVGFVVSCRSGYVQALLSSEPEASGPKDLGFIEVKHTGFVGREWKAASTFFSHWELTLPDFPLLVPEYSNPLFLKLLCQSLNQAGEKTLPRGATGITALFERFLREANRRLSGPDRCNFRPKDNVVSKAVRALAQAMLARKEDYVPYSEFHDICEDLLPGRDWDKSLDGGLVDEGVLARDLFADDDVVRLSYQRLGDHLQSAELLEAKDDEAVRLFLADLTNDPMGFYRSSGLLEALAVQLPEKRGRELHDLVADPGQHAIQDAFLESIIWRDPKSFPGDLPLNYLDSIRRYGHHDPVLDTMLHVACVPGHPFNAELLDRNLARLRLPDRDAWWTTHISGASREDSVAYRIIEWARSSQQKLVADDAAGLAAMTLTWFLAASNRELRDCATKALVALLWKRLPLLVELLSQFDSVDDPYIAERLYAVAYGCALSTEDAAGLETLAGTVFDKVFADGKPPVHIMLRDYARGVVEVSADRGGSAASREPRSRTASLLQSLARTPSFARAT